MKKWEKEYLHSMRLRACDDNLDSFKNTYSYQMLNIKMGIIDIFNKEMKNITKNLAIYITAIFAIGITIYYLMNEVRSLEELLY